MIKVTVGNNMKKNTVIVEATTTLRSVLEDNHVDYTVAMPWLDGTPLQPGDLDKTFAQIGITAACTLLCVQNKQNA